MSKKTKITDLTPDNKNFNQGSEFGSGLLEKSLQKFGAGRSVLIDKNNRIIAGNKTAEKFGELGGENVLIVDADRDTLVAVRRNDIDLDSPAGREMALADNAVAKANIVWNAEVLEAEAEEIKLTDWGVFLPKGDADEEETEEPQKYSETKYPLSIVLNKAQMMQFDDLKKELDVKEDTTAFLRMLKQINELKK